MCSHSTWIIFTPHWNNFTHQGIFFFTHTDYWNWSHTPKERLFNHAHYWNTSWEKKFSCTTEIISHTTELFFFAHARCWKALAPKDLALAPTAELLSHSTKICFAQNVYEHIKLFFKLMHTLQKCYSVTLVKWFHTLWKYFSLTHKTISNNIFHLCTLEKISHYGNIFCSHITHTRWQYFSLTSKMLSHTKERNCLNRFRFFSTSSTKKVFQ